MIDEKLAGLELAMINRLNVFNYNNEEAKIVTFHFNRFQHMNTQKYGISDHDYVNLFDYFQETVDIDDQKILDNYLTKILEKINQSFPNNYLVKHNNFLEVYQDGNKVVEITFFRNSKDRVSNVKWYGFDNKLIREDGYDSRGFLSISSFFGQKGGVASEDVYNIRGQVVINFYYHETDNNNSISNTSIHLNYKHNHKVFNDLQELTAFFYDDLVKDSNSIFIVDRSYLVDASVFKMKNKVKVFEFWHNTFSSTNNQYGSLSNVMVQELLHNQKISGYILPTKKGADELKNRIPKIIPVYNATVAINKVNHHYSSYFDPDKIIMVARIDRQKQIHHAIKAFSIIHKKRPNAKLYIYGYIFDNEYNLELLSLTKKLGLVDYIVYEHYRSDKDSIYKDAAVMIMTSRNEGWGMVINESLARGIPVVSYDTCYGPSEIITNGDDGYIVEINDYVSLSERVLHILCNKNIRKTLSLNGVKNMERYNIENVSLIWKDLSKKLLNDK